MGSDQQTVELFENRCCVCYVPIPQYRHGRLRRTCSAACRQKLYRMRQRPLIPATCGRFPFSHKGRRGPHKTPSIERARTNHSPTQRPAR